MVGWLLNPKRKRKSRRRGGRKGKMPAALARYWAKKRRTRKGRKAHRRGGRKGRMPKALARFWAKVRGRKLNRRKHRKNVWWNDKPGHSKAAYKGWAGRRGHNRRRRNNPALSLGGFKPLAAFKPSTLMQAAPIAGGAFANMWLTPTIAGYLPATFKTGLGKAAVGLGSAGVLGAVAGIAAPRFASGVVAGAVAQTLIEAAAGYLTGVAAGPVRSVVPASAQPKTVAATARKVAVKKSTVAEYTTPWSEEMAGSPGSLAGVEYFGQEDLDGEL